MVSEISVTQYGSLFAANGCRLDFDSLTAKLFVAEIPKSSRKIVDAALADIAKFENTSNYADGVVAIHLAHTVDRDPNPISDRVRTNVLSALGITRDGKFIAQQIAQQKTNRSWHLSEKPNECTYFGDVCTKRGVIDVPGKRGRKSTRSPEQYHMRSKSGEISREQLVTPALEDLVTHIPAANLVSISGGSGTIGINIDNLKEEEIAELLEKINKMKESRKTVVSV